MTRNTESEINDIINNDDDEGELVKSPMLYYQALIEVLNDASIDEAEKQIKLAKLETCLYFPPLIERFQQAYYKKYSNQAPYSALNLEKIKWEPHNTDLFVIFIYKKRLLGEEITKSMIDPVFKQLNISEFESLDIFLEQLKDSWSSWVINKDELANYLKSIYIPEPKKSNHHTFSENIITTFSSLKRNRSRFESSISDNNESPNKRQKVSNLENQGKNLSQSLSEIISPSRG